MQYYRIASPVLVDRRVWDDSIRVQLIQMFSHVVASYVDGSLYVPQAGHQVYVMQVISILYHSGEVQLLISRVLPQWRDE